MSTAAQPKIILSAEDRASAAFAALGRNVDKLGLNFDALKGGALGALAALSVPISAGAIIGIANESRHAIDDLKDLTEAVGSSVEKISALDGLNREVGGSFETLSTVLVKFNAMLKDAKPDEGAGAVLKALNLDIKELKELDPADALQKVAVELSNWADDGNRARAVQELFGKSVKEVGPFLRDLAEAGQLNARITTAQAEEVDKFNKELAKLKATSEDVGRSFSVGIITEINTLIDKFKDAEKAGKSFWRVILLTPEEMAAKNKRAGVFQGNNESAAETARLSNAGSLYAADNQSVAELSRLTRQSQLKSLQIPDKPSSSGGASTAGKDPYAEANRYLEALRKQLQTTGELTTYEKLLEDIRVGALGKLTPQLQARLESTAKMIDADKELNKITKEFADLSEAAAKAQKELQAEGQGFYEATRTPIERLNIELAKQDELLRKLGPSYKDTYMRAQEAAQDRYDAETKVQDKLSELDQFTQRAAQNMQDYLGSSFQQIMEGNFSNIGDAFTSMLNNMVAQAAAAQLSKYLFGDLLTGKSGGSNGAIGDFLGSAASSLFGGFRADGGPVQKGKGYIVGERGPEWFEPATSGTVVPNHALGGTTQHISISVAMPQGASRATAQQFGQQVARQISMAQARNG